MPRAARSDTRLDTGLFVACLAVAAFAVILPPSLRDPAASALRRTLVAPLVALQRTAERGRNALATHDELTRSRDSLALLAQRSASLETDNARLRQLLGLAADLRWGFVSAEALQGRGPGEDYTVALTVGAGAGVKPFSPVVAPEGLVGMVLSADPGLSMAMLWAHPDFRASAMSADGGAFGIIKAHGGPGASRWLLELNGIPFRQQLKPGTRILTSGLGGTYPRGIPIGTVVEERKTSEGYARSYLVRPAVSPADLSAVMVLLPPRAREGVDGVWPAPPAAEAVARAGQGVRDSVRQASARDTARPVTPRSDSSAAAAVPVPSPASGPAAPRRDSLRPPEPR
ncbi:MAG: rod shape-determining protein MreC [Gemmatimonadaceae bacterium]|nr:rod shape-determining protein MreC [Gemmatimonadaceae bacterium]